MIKRTCATLSLLCLSACSDAPVDGASVTDAAAPWDTAVTRLPDSGSADARDAEVVSDAAVVDAADASLPPGVLDTTVVEQIVEPEGSGKDDANNSYTDQNYWNFCMPGAVTVALYYFLPSNVTTWPAADFKEPANAPNTIPAAGTHWKSDEKVNGYHTYGRAYLMYLAEEVKPPSFKTAGTASFASYPTTGATLVDAREVLNWEASKHAANYGSFFYSIVSASGLTANKLHADVKSTIDGGHAVVVAADTAKLPNWSRSLSHAITIVGYDDVAKTYKYTDTCGVHCNGSPKSKNGGLWNISQVTMFDSIVADGAGYIK